MLSKLLSQFTPVTTDDISLLQSYFQLCDYEEANHSVAGFYIWLDAYPIWKYVDPNYLLLLGVHEQQYFIYMPFCKEEFYETALKKAQAIFANASYPFRCSCYIKELVDVVCSIFPQATFQEFREDADYVYESTSLQTFAGKKLQKKRNHLRAFEKLYENQYEYEVLKAHHKEECLIFLKKWIQGKDDAMLEYEYNGIIRIFNYFEQLQLYGGILRIHNEIEAFTIASNLSSRMVQIHIEKANDTYRGIYQMICKQFALHLPKNLIYINREDDMGLENLRQAKLSYRPTYLINKYMITI